MSTSLHHVYIKDQCPPDIKSALLNAARRKEVATSKKVPDIMTRRVAAAE